MKRGREVVKAWVDSNLKSEKKVKISSDITCFVFGRRRVGEVKGGGLETTPSVTVLEANSQFPRPG